MASTIVENLHRLQERMNRACARCNRSPESVRLVAVSKTVAPERIREALAAGITILGENYIQEARQKIELIGKPVSWHFIGHLQSNKAKYAVDLFDMIHSVDSLHLAESISKEAQKKDKTIPVLIQVNISGEESKHGLNPDTTLRLIQDAGKLPNLTINGFMTMPPLSENPEDSRPYFRALRNLRDMLAAKKPEQVALHELSMGMSSDFEVAIEEGATLVRIGTSLFGPR
jgi:PLP dependent protein